MTTITDMRIYLIFFYKDQIDDSERLVILRQALVMDFCKLPQNVYHNEEFHFYWILTKS